MSDNYYFIRADLVTGEFAVETRVASCEYDINVPIQKKAPRFKSLPEAEVYAFHHPNEYGVKYEYK